VQLQKQDDVCGVQNTVVVKEMQRKITKLASKCLTMDSLKENEKLVKFYTGLLDYDMMKAVFDLACKCLPSTAQHGLCKLINDEFLLTMVKLRVNLRNANLGFCFGIAESTVSTIIHNWLNLLLCFHKVPNLLANKRGSMSNPSRMFLTKV